ncbi:MAG: hypothetical protein ACO2PN_16270 [Pyrobaculum sp.]
MSTKLKRKQVRKRKRGGIRRHKFAMCAKKCRGNKNCMSTCLKK